VVLEVVAVRVEAAGQRHRVGHRARVPDLAEDVLVVVDVRVRPDVGVERRAGELADAVVGAHLREHAIEVDGDRSVHGLRAVGRGGHAGEVRVIDRLAVAVAVPDRAADLPVEVAAVESGVAADRTVRVGAGPAVDGRRLVGLDRDDVDDADERVGAVDRRHRATDDLDAGHVVQRDRQRRRAVDELAPRLVERGAVDQDEDARVGIAEQLDAADADPLDHPVVGDVDPGDRPQRLGERAVSEPTDRVAGDDGDGAGHRAERLLALGGADDGLLVGQARTIDADLRHLGAVGFHVGKRRQVADRNSWHVPVGV
jgi:hypothetical protein